MINPEEIPIYNEVKRLASQQGYTIEIHKLEESNPLFDEAYGAQEVEKRNKILKVYLRPDCKQLIETFVHEIFHAKLFLQGFPKIYLYDFNYGSGPDSALTNIENTVQHTQIYRMMKQEKFSQSILDNEFFESVKEKIHTEYTGPNKLDRALRIFEAYVRTPALVEGIEQEISQFQPIEYKIYKRLRRLSKNTSTPKDMRKTIVNIIKYVDEFLKKEMKHDLFLRYLTRMEPIFTPYELEQKANKILSPVNLSGESVTFVIKNAEDYCCYFLNLDYAKTNEMLNTLTLRQFIQNTGGVG